MKQTNIIHYTIQHTCFADLQKSLRSLGEGVVRLIFFCQCSGNAEYIRRYNMLAEECNNIWGDQRPIVTLVAQPCLDAELSIEVHSVEGELSFEQHKGGRSIRVSKPFGELLFVGELQGDVASQSIEQLSEAVFSSARMILGDIEANKIVRQWNYIERITDMEGQNQHYQLFNNARSCFYGECSWDGGYPAATGIGMDCGGVAVDIDVVIPAQGCEIKPIDNSLQQAAHRYSEQVLFDANRDKSTPKFERAKSVEVQAEKLTYISGTAAIEGEQSMASSSAKEQTLATLHNIDQLIESREQIMLLRIYIKNREDHNAVRQVIEQQIDHPIATLYVIADVCREELLVEIEGIAQKKLINKTNRDEFKINFSSCGDVRSGRMLRHAAAVKQRMCRDKKGV